MIPAIATSGQSPGWQQLWRESITNVDELLSVLGLTAYKTDLVPVKLEGFPLRVPRGFVARMGYGNPNDPLLLQILPRAVELDEMPGFTHDAVGDLRARAASGVLHKYRGRALLITTGACAIHCRYCFRRHFPYHKELATANRWEEALDYLRHDSSISEVILSGGDPMSLATAKLRELTQALSTVIHIRRLRIHTRLPIVLPERVDNELETWISELPWPTMIVIHANHANEIDNAVIAACKRLRQTGAMLLNQSVLLRGINDCVTKLAELCERLFDCAVLPYYIHQLDRVAGAAHFAVDDQQAVDLIEKLRCQLPGYLVPRLVREIEGLEYKYPISGI